MKKTKRQLLMIITNINKQYWLTRAANRRDWLTGRQYCDNAITLNGNKGEQVAKIVKEFSKINDISKGGSFMVKISGKKVSRVIRKEYLPEYKRLAFKQFMLLVSIIKNNKKA